MENSLDIPIRELLTVIQARTFETTYFGVPAIKNPLDFWTYQEIIFELKPRVIVEIGTNFGGTTLALAHLLDHIGQGFVISVDLDHGKVPTLVKNHPRIRLVTGDASECFLSVRDLCGNKTSIMVIEDSAHTYDNTLNILRRYSALVTRGSYLIVEDGICNHGLEEGPRPGPYEAVEQFLRECHDFKVDRSREAYLITWNPKGYLLRK